MGYTACACKFVDYTQRSTLSVSVGHIACVIHMYIDSRNMVSIALVTCNGGRCVCSSSSSSSSSAVAVAATEAAVA